MTDVTCANAAHELSAEEWRPIVGYEGAYEISNLGRVRTVPRRFIDKRGHPQVVKARNLSIYTGDKYSKVRLNLAGSGSTKNVHTLVAEAFIGPRPDGMEVCHNNGRAHDNRLDNLRYDTHSNNLCDRVSHGTDHLAGRSHCNYGHEFTPENTIARTGPNESGRRCRACDTARGKRRWQEEKEARAA